MQLYAIVSALISPNVAIFLPLRDPIPSSLYSDPATRTTLPYIALLPFDGEVKLLRDFTTFHVTLRFRFLTISTVFLEQTTKWPYLRLHNTYALCFGTVKDIASVFQHTKTKYAGCA